MKNIIAVLVLTMMSGVACKKVDKLTQFNIEYDASVVIPSSAGINLPFNLFTPDIESNSESKFAVNDTRKDLIEEIILTSLDLTLESPANGDFGFLKSVDIYISAEGLSEQRVAWKSNIPSTVGKYLDLETTGVDLQEYVKADEFNLRVNTVTDEAIASDHHIDIHSVFFVDAKVLGQ